MSKPIYKKWWFYLIIILIIAAIAGNSDTNKTNTTVTTTNSTTTIIDRQVKNATDLYNKILSEYQNGNYEQALNKYSEYISKYSDVQISGDIEVLRNDIENALPHITAEELAKAYEENEVRADELYKNKIIVVTGTIEDIGKDILDQTYITLSNGEKYSLKHPQFYFKDATEISKIANLNKGDKVVIQGKCDGASVMKAIIKNCIIK